MQGKHKVAPAPKEPNIVKILCDEMDGHWEYKPQIIYAKGSLVWLNAATGIPLTTKGMKAPGNSIVSARVVKQEQCCVVQ